MIIVFFKDLHSFSLMLFLYSHRPYTFPQIFPYRHHVRGVSVSERLRLYGVHIPSLWRPHTFFMAPIFSFYIYFPYFFHIINFIALISFLCRECKALLSAAYTIASYNLFIIPSYLFHIYLPFIQYLY